MLYIDAYWVVKGDQTAPVGQRIYPDGCIDIILNLGSEFLTDSGVFKMKPDSVYLVGTMTRYKDAMREADTFLVGIRFKPLGFPAFFKFSSLHDITEKTIDFNKKLLPEIHQYDDKTIPLLNKFFCDQLSVRNHSLFEVIETINRKNGIISIEAVARKHFTTGGNWKEISGNISASVPKSMQILSVINMLFGLSKKRT